MNDSDDDNRIMNGMSDEQRGYLKAYALLAGLGIASAIAFALLIRLLMALR